MTTIQVSFWFKALRTIQRVSKEQWAELDIISRWLVATRSSVLIMTAISAAIGGLLAYASGSFSLQNFLICFLGLNLAHAANNLVNDWVDYKKGIDKENYFRSLYGPQVLEHQYLGARSFNLYVFVTLVLALACGAILVLNSPVTVLYLGLAGLFFLLFYTWPLKYIGLGEPSVILVWGPLMIGGTYFVTAGYNWSWNVAAIAAIYAIGPASVLFGKHIDKLKQDMTNKVFTLPVIIGEKLSRYSVILLWAMQYILFTWLVIQGTFTFPVLIIFLALPLWIKTLKLFLQKRPDERPESYSPQVWPLYFVRFAFEYNRRFSLLFLVGLIIHVIIIKSGLLG
jgi:1,4-dihydroxy-2-naphthoate polyprenyltransferase